MRIVPYSHKLDTRPPNSDNNPDGDPEGAIDLIVKRGTAVLFDRRMWHSRGWNFSDATRKVLFMGYSYRWLRGLDYNLMPPETLEKCDPIRRQLLGDGVDIKGLVATHRCRCAFEDVDCRASRRGISTVEA